MPCGTCMRIVKFYERFSKIGKVDKFLTNCSVLVDCYVSKSFEFDTYPLNNKF